jgi:hypothetical protein
VAGNWIAQAAVLRYRESMTLEAIKDEISRLSETERASLADWLNAQEAELWDRQIEADFSEGGAGMALLEQWDAEIESSQSIALDDFLDERRRS